MFQVSWQYWLKKKKQSFVIKNIVNRWRPPATGHLFFSVAFLAKVVQFISLSVHHTVSLSLCQFITVSLSLLICLSESSSISLHHSVSPSFCQFTTVSSSFIQCTQLTHATSVNRPCFYQKGLAFYRHHFFMWPGLLQASFFHVLNYKNKNRV